MIVVVANLCLGFTCSAFIIWQGYTIRRLRRENAELRSSVYKYLRFLFLHDIPRWNGRDFILPERRLD